MKQNILNAWASFRDEILSSPRYLGLALVLAAIVFVFTIWLPNIGLIWDVMFSGDFSFFGKVIFLWNSLGAISTNFSLFTAGLTVIISILFGLNIALTVDYFKRRLAFQKATGISLLGMLVGLIGIGCASCGSIVLASLLGVSATISFTGVLPFGGAEFGILSIIILIFAMYVTAKKLADPLVCGIRLTPNGMRDNF